MLSLFLKRTCNIIWCVYLFGLGVNFSNGLDEIKNVVVELWKDKTTSSLAKVKTLQNAWIGFGPRGNIANIHSLYLYILKKNCIFKDNVKNRNPRNHQPSEKNSGYHVTFSHLKNVFCKQNFSLWTRNIYRWKMV